MSRTVIAPQPLTVAGPAGSLEARIDTATDSPRAVAVLCHPHPLHQGTMDNKVVATLARSVARLDAAAVRFNFRGVGASAGNYDEGAGETDDALAVVEWARERWPGLPTVLGGFSFGGAVALAAAARCAPFALVTVAPAVARLPGPYAPPACPWLLVQGDADEVVPTHEVLAFIDALARPPSALAVLPGVGHFFHGELAALDAELTKFLEPLFATIGRGQETRDA